MYRIEHQLRTVPCLRWYSNCCECLRNPRAIKRMGGIALYPNLYFSPLMGHRMTWTQVGWLGHCRWDTGGCNTVVIHSRMEASSCKIVISRLGKSVFRAFRKTRPPDDEIFGGGVPLTHTYHTLILFVLSLYACLLRLYLTRKGNAGHRKGSGDLLTKCWDVPCCVCPPPPVFCGTLP